MTSSLSFCLPVLLLASASLGLSTVARAQTTPGTPGTCTGMVNNKMVSGKVYLLVDGKQVTPPAGTTAGIFDLAECQCNPTDTTAVQFHVLMDAAGLIPRGTTGAVQMFIGQSDCDTLTTRNTGTCEPVTAVQLDVASFESTSPIDIPIPAQVLTDPLSAVMRDTNPPPTHMCGNINTQWNVTIVIGPDPPNAYATCRLPLPVKTTPPTPPANVSLSQGDGALTVNWDLNQNDQSIERYQVLCRDTTLSGPPATPLVGEDQLYYSACVNGTTLHRRVSIPGVGSISTPSPDGGTGTGIGTMGTGTTGQALSRAPHAGPPGPLSDDMGTTDDMAGAADMAAPSDMAAAADMGASGDGGDGGAPDMVVPSALDTLDPAYLCSGQIQGSGTARLEGLTNGHAYEVRVVAIDYFGNPAASVSAFGTPIPTQNLGEALRNAGNDGGGFGCAAARHPATAATFGLLPLLALLGFRLVRRRRPEVR